MITIQQLKAMPTGSKTGGFTFIVKHTKKTMNTSGNRAKTGWMQQVVLMDKTGDMLADINIDTYRPLGRGQQVRCIVTEVRDNYTKQGDKLLYVDQFSFPPGITADEYDAGMKAETEEWAASNDKVNRGKVRHGLCCAYVRAVSNAGVFPATGDISKAIINEWVDFIMDGN